MPTDHTESAQVAGEVPPPTPYTDAVEAYLVEADWLGVLDGPFVVQARQLAKSLDLQIARAGEVQSALASTFDKVLLRLEARRPPAAPAPVNPADAGADGTSSIFGLLEDQ